MRLGSALLIAFATLLGLGGCDDGGGGGGGLAIEDVPASSSAIICETVFGCLDSFGSLFGTEAACQTSFEQGIRNGDYQLWTAAIAAGYLALYSGPQMTTIVNERNEIVWDWSVDGELPRDRAEDLGSAIGGHEPRERAKPLLDPI